MKYQAVCKDCSPVNPHTEEYDCWKSMKYPTEKQAEIAAEWHDSREHNGELHAEIESLK